MRPKPLKFIRKGTYETPFPVSAKLFGTCREVFPTLREVLPTGREVLPTGREVLLTGREVLLTGREVLLTGREVLLTLREVLPTGREVLPTLREVLPTLGERANHGHLPHRNRPPKSAPCIEKNLTTARCRRIFRTKPSENCIIRRQLPKTSHASRHPASP